MADILEVSVSFRSLSSFYSDSMNLFLPSVSQHSLPSLPPISRGAAGPAGGVQSPDGGDGGDAVDAGSPQRQLPVMAALCGGAEMFGLL